MQQMKSKSNRNHSNPKKNNPHTKKWIYLHRISNPNLLLFLLRYRKPRTQNLSIVRNGFLPLNFTHFSFVALFFTCDNCGIRYSNRNTLDAHREHYCIKRDQAKNHSTGKNSNCDKLIFISKRSSIVIKSTRTHTHVRLIFSRFNNARENQEHQTQTFRSK